ncbi:hypothetical protein [Helicobacter winghamensis]
MLIAKAISFMDTKHFATILHLNFLKNGILCQNAMIKSLQFLINAI